MAEFIADEIQVAVAGGGQGCQTRHFVTGHAAVNRQTAGVFVHGVIHIFADQAEDDGLAADNRLIMAFDIADRLFIAPPVGEFMP